MSHHIKPKKMKKQLFFLVMAFMLIGRTANARGLSFKMGGLRNVSFEIPNDYKCDTLDKEYFIFRKDSVEFTVEIIAIDNFNQKKAITMPDSILVPNAAIVSREVPGEEPVSRIITSKLDDGSLIRHYVFFTRSGIVIMASQASNREEIDQIVNSFESHFKWGKLLLFILLVVIGMLPSMVFAMALGYRKKNLQKFWPFCIIALLMIVIISIAFSIWKGINFWILLFGYLLCSVALGYCMDKGFIIF